jgi:hypothetical protein
VSAKVSALNSLRSSARPCRPRFSFFCIQFSKNRPWDKNPPPKITSSLSAKQIQPSGQTRKRTILMRSHNLVTRTARSTRSQANQPNHRAHSATASGAPPSLCRYIDPAPQNCQHTKSQKIRTFIITATTLGINLSMQGLCTNEYGRYKHAAPVNTNRGCLGQRVGRLNDGVELGGIFALLARTIA